MFRTCSVSHTGAVHVNVLGNGYTHISHKNIYHTHSNTHAHKQTFQESKFMFVGLQCNLHWVLTKNLAVL